MPARSSVHPRSAFGLITLACVSVFAGLACLGGCKKSTATSGSGSGAPVETLLGVLPFTTGAGSGNAASTLRMAFSSAPIGQTEVWNLPLGTFSNGETPVLKRSVPLEFEVSLTDGQTGSFYFQRHFGSWPGSSEISESEFDINSVDFIGYDLTKFVIDIYELKIWDSGFPIVSSYEVSMDIEVWGMPEPD